MKQIEFERWEPDAENPCKLNYAGQRTAEDVFHELEARLDSVGYLPDEYLLLDTRWQNGREMPRDAGFFCRTDYGGSEGIYLDMFLEWYEDSQHKTEHFMTGKTLGESGADMDRMSLISSAITKAFRGDNSVHARYMVVGGQSGPEETMSLNLSPDEQRLVAQALAEQRIRLGPQAEGEEKLLRRITGSVTEYMDAAGLADRLTESDRALLAQHDGAPEAAPSWAGCSYEHERNSHPRGGAAADQRKGAQGRRLFTHRHLCAGYPDCRHPLLDHIGWGRPQQSGGRSVVLRNQLYRFRAC